jgi:hypothetical protein
MFLFRSRQPHHSRKPNQLSFVPISSLSPEAAARRTRGIDRLERLAEIAMELAERAGVRCIAAENEPEPETQPNPAPAHKQERMVFDRLARTVKDLTITISRLDAGLIPQAPAPEPPERDDWPTQTDPRRPLILRTVHEAIKSSPHPPSEHAALKKIAERRTQQFLAADPGQTHAPGAAIYEICNELRLPFDANKWEDDLILPPNDPRLRARQERDDLSQISGVYHPP